MTEQSELLELLLEEVALRLEDIKVELTDIITETLGWGKALALIPTRAENRRAIRARVVRWLDYIKSWHGDTDDYVAETLGITVHAIKDEWRVEGKSLPGLNNYEALRTLYNTERRLHGEPEE